MEVTKAVGESRARHIEEQYALISAAARRQLMLEERR
jgi:hypothetical protein